MASPGTPSRPNDPRGDEETDLAVRERVKVEPPRLWRVLLHNDDYTTMEFVIAVLVEVFRRTESEAQEIMWSVHRRGIGVAGLYPKEIAETKAARCIELARANEYPLLCTTEPDE